MERAVNIGTELTFIQFSNKIIEIVGDLEYIEFLSTYSLEYNTGRKTLKVEIVQRGLRVVFSIFYKKNIYEELPLQNVSLSIVRLTLKSVRDDIKLSKIVTSAWIKQNGHLFLLSR